MNYFFENLLKIFQVDYLLGRAKQVKDFSSGWLALSEKIGQAVMEDELEVLLEI